MAFADRSSGSWEVDQARERMVRWLPMVAGEYRVRAMASWPDGRHQLWTMADRLERAPAPGLDLLEEVGLQLALWDCRPEAPGKATWLSLAADDLARVALGPRPPSRN